MSQTEARPETPPDGTEERRDPSSSDLVHAVVDVVMGHPNARNRKRALAWLLGVVLGPVVMHWGLNLQAKADLPDPKEITAKLEAHDAELKAIKSEVGSVSNDVKTMAGNVDTLTRFVIGDRPMPVTVRPQITTAPTMTAPSSP